MTLFIILISIVLLFLLISYACYKKTFYVGPKANRDPHIMLEGKQYKIMEEKILSLVDGALSIDGEDVFITSFDGLKLHGMYYEVKKGAPVEIMMHGYKSIALRDFCGALQFTLKGGHNVLLVDQRAHGQSEGRCLTFGVLESKDCLSWANYVRERFGENTEIVLVGVSMGAATVLMASDLNLPENVAGIVADSGYSSPEKIIKKVIRDMRLPVSLSYPFVYMGAKIFGHFNLHGAAAKDSVKRCKIPILFFHGEADTFVPCEMSREMYSVSISDKTLLTVAGADHGLEYLVDNDSYMEALKGFLEKIGCGYEL